MVIMKRSNRPGLGAGGAIVFDEVTSEPWVMSKLEQYGDKVREQLSQSSVPRIPLSDVVRTVSLLGKGSFSKVYKVQVRPPLPSNSSLNVSSYGSNDYVLNNHYKKDNKQHMQQYDKNNDDSSSCCYALKCLNPKRMTSEDVFLVATADLGYEITILSQLDHENIVRLEGVASEDFASSFLSSSTSSWNSSPSAAFGGDCKSRCGYYMLLEILTETLEARLRRWRELKKRSALLPTKDRYQEDRRSRMARGLSAHLVTTKELWQVIEIENRIRNVMQGLAEAIRYLHSKKIVVRDVKPDNVGFTSRGTVKLFDFGFARRIEDCQNGEIAGSFRYMAPENMKGMKSDLTSDVYSFGVLLWEVATLKKPYDELLHQRSQSDQSPHDIRANLAQKLSIQDGGQGWRMETNDIRCTRTRALIERCWNPHPESRPDFDSICLEMEAICAGDVGADSYIRGVNAMDLASQGQQIKRCKPTRSPASTQLMRRLSRTLYCGSSHGRLIRLMSDPTPFSGIGNDSPRRATDTDSSKKCNSSRLFEDNSQASIGNTHHSTTSVYLP